MNILWKKQISFVLLLSLVLGSYKGYIALFDKGSTEPRQIFPYSTASLPPADQLALENGIPIRSETELSSILEDFLS